MLTHEPGPTRSQIDEPLVYTYQLYNLRLHNKLMQQKLESVGTDAPTL